MTDINRIRKGEARKNNERKMIKQKIPVLVAIEMQRKINLPKTKEGRKDKKCRK